MSKKLATWALGLATALLPAVSFANTSVVDEIEAGIEELTMIDSSIVDFNDALISGYVGGGYHPGGGRAPSAGHAPVRGHVAPRRPLPPPRRPVYRVHPRTEVVVIEQPRTTQVTTVAESTHVERVGSRFGIGVRVLGSKVSNYVLADGDCESMDVAPGVGWYLKYRPVRWVSVEFMNDYIFMTNEYNESFIRMPLYAGLQTHIFDYGDLDVYLAAAGGVTYVRMNDNQGRNSDDYFQWGGQFGGGISFLLGVIELGLDARYTIEGAPEDHYYDNKAIQYDSSQVVHGVTFSLNVGFGI